MVQNKSEANFYVRSFLFLLGHYVSSHLCFAKSSSTPWHLDRLDQRNGIDFSPFNGEVVARTRPVLYVIDSGIEQDHKEFTSGLSAVIDGYNFVNESWECGDCMGHGTHVAGLAAGHEYGVAGSIGADIVSVRVLDCHGRGSCSSLIRALEWVHRNHSVMRSGVPGVVVMSIGSRQSECEGVNELASSLSGKDIIVVAAAGNSAADACTFHPASSRNVITVAAMSVIHNQDLAWQKTNFGDCVDIFAPGVSIESAWPGSEYRNATRILSGTSMAAPLVAGQALLIVAAVPEISIASLREVIQESASRGTILGGQIDPNAEGSRVARVPWLGLQSGHDVSFSYGSVSELTHFSFDNLTIGIETSSRTEPVMQYAVDHITRKIFEAVKDEIATSAGSRLHVVCNNVEPPATSQYSALQKAIASSDRTRGWDARQENADAGVFSVHVICNITVETGTGKRVKTMFQKLVSDAKLQDLFGQNVKLLSEPILISNRELAPPGKTPSWKILIISICSCLGVGLVLGMAATWIRKQHKG